jgi:hypothetical protein
VRSERSKCLGVLSELIPVTRALIVKPGTTTRTTTTTTTTRMKRIERVDGDSEWPCNCLLEGGREKGGPVSRKEEVEQAMRQVSPVRAKRRNEESRMVNGSRYTKRVHAMPFKRKPPPDASVPGSETHVSIDTSG